MTRHLAVEVDTAVQLVGSSPADFFFRANFAMVDVDVDILDAFGRVNDCEVFNCET